MRLYGAMVRSPHNKLGPVPPAGTEYAAWLTSSLQSYEKLAKTLVEHRAEKGRIVESVVNKCAPRDPAWTVQHRDRVRDHRLGEVNFSVGHRDL